jgi:D-beta-D-heptose 7-phosphate kinase/D-beta-D-heptose 1-phosphate adenosyltransferase
MVITFNQLPLIRDIHKEESIVLVGGCYDLFHRGHLEYLKKCSKLGDILIVAPSSDKRIQERKGVERPIIHQEDRVRIIEALEFVHYALIAPTPKKNISSPTVRMIDALKPDIFATADNRHEMYKKELERKGVKVCYVSPAKRRSTTEIIASIQKRSTPCKCHHQSM